MHGNIEMDSSLSSRSKILTRQDWTGGKSRNSKLDILGIAETVPNRSGAQPSPGTTCPKVPCGEGGSTETLGLQQLQLAIRTKGFGTFCCLAGDWPNVKKAKQLKLNGLTFVNGDWIGHF